MRTLLNRSLLRIVLLSLVATVAFPAAGVTSTAVDRKPADSAYNRSPMIQMALFGAESTALNAKDLVIPLLAQADVPMLSGVPWTVATISAAGDGSPVVNAAPAPSAASNASSSKLPHSSPWAALAATTMLVAFFLFRRAQ
ncbi:MAG: hypothetical protein ABI327_01040 [Burkholderiaceae bacterium]